MPTILLVETDPFTARRNAESLVRAGFLVEISATGHSTAGSPPDLVVLSVSKLERSALATVVRTAVPHLIISSDPTDAGRAMEFGCAAVLIRPVMYDELVNAVRRIVTTIPSVA